MIKKILITLVTLLLSINLASFAQMNTYGLGLIINEPTGLSGKMWLSRSTALAGAIGWSPLQGRRLHIHADFLFYRYSFHSDPKVDFSVYIGVGGKIIFQENDNAWLRFPLGIDFLAKKSPLNIFFEVIPSTNFSEFDLWGALGIRYTFNR